MLLWVTLAETISTDAFALLASSRMAWPMRSWNTAKERTYQSNFSPQSKRITGV